MKTSYTHYLHPTTMYNKYLQYGFGRVFCLCTLVLLLICYYYIDGVCWYLSGVFTCMIGWNLCYFFFFYLFLFVKWSFESLITEIYHASCEYKLDFSYDYRDLSLSNCNGFIFFLRKEFWSFFESWKQLITKTK